MAVKARTTLRQFPAGSPPAAWAPHATSHGDAAALGEGAGGGRIQGWRYLLSSAEVYDPATGNWRSPAALTPHASFTRRHYCHSGKVLVVGGTFGGSDFLRSAEVYDPATGMWSSTGNLGTARYFHTATLLPSGKVLVAGGRDSNGSYLSSAELYDPATGSWSSTGSLGTGRGFHTATLLPLVRYWWWEDRTAMIP